MKRRNHSHDEQDLDHCTSTIVSTADMAYASNTRFLAPKSRRFWLAISVASIAIGLVLLVTGGRGHTTANPEGHSAKSKPLLLPSSSVSPSNCGNRQSQHATANSKYVVSRDKNKSGPVVDLKAPPMGFMSWERFRCTINCQKYPNDCIHEDLYKSTADAMVEKGLVAAGYTQVSIDDCWVDKKYGRDSATGRLRPDALRFPNGMKVIGDYLHDKGMRYGIYSDAGIKTCGGYEGSYGHAQVDAETFAEWGVDYVKLDGCWMTLERIVDPQSNFEAAYTAFGNALRNVSRPMVYSCSWPAYIGSDESKKPFDTMYTKSACNLWRNWADIDNSWKSLYKIMMHWAQNWKALQQIPDGSFNDADMLLVGDDHYASKRGESILTLDQSRVQMGFWAMIASPLMIGGDVRSMKQDFVDILTNPHVIAINQDPSRRQADCIKGCGDGFQKKTPRGQKPRGFPEFPTSLEQTVGLWQEPCARLFQFELGHSFSIHSG